MVNSLFTAWLRASQKAEHYSYCTYCDKHLKANRRSLLDHAKSRVHLDMMPGGPGRPGRRRTMQNVLLPDEKHDPLYMTDGDPGDEDDLDDYDDSYIEGNGSNFVTTEMENSFDENGDMVDTKEGIILPDSEEDEDSEQANQNMPMVQLGPDAYNGYEKNKRQLNTSVSSQK